MTVPDPLSDWLHPNAFLAVQSLTPTKTSPVVPTVLFRVKAENQDAAAHPAERDRCNTTESPAMLLEGNWSSSNREHARRLVGELRDLADRIDAGDGLQRLPEAIVVAVLGETSFQIATAGRLRIKDCHEVAGVLCRDALRFAAP